jgi:multicomponent Na+:H+ antiporter subunit G
MMSVLLPWIADVLVILGVMILCIAMYGMTWMSDPYTRLHAASKAVFPGLTLLLAAAATTGESAIISRAILIGVFLLFTAPVSAHSIAAAIYRQSQQPAKEPRDALARPLSLPETIDIEQNSLVSTVHDPESSN